MAARAPRKTGFSGTSARRPPLKISNRSADRPHHWATPADLPCTAPIDLPCTAQTAYPASPKRPTLHRPNGLPCTTMATTTKASIDNYIDQLANLASQEKKAEAQSLVNKL